MPLEGDANPRVRTLEDDQEDQEQDQQNKRRRTNGGRFAPGSIIRVSLKNFVTYTSAEFYPGPNMNLVIGPNGSGKSTIVCAICLGLGYSPNVLARATAVGDFVQHGKDTAEIEVELAKDNGESVVVKRKIKRDKNQSTYFLNGKLETQGKVQELMASFNIQIDNLCQFLPQDRVASFAQLSPTQLLKETQRAVGGQEMVAHWERLCNFRSQERDLQTDIKNDAKTLTNLIQRQEAAKVQVERLHKQNEIISRIDNLKIRIPIAKYSAAKREYDEFRNLRSDAKKKAQEFQEKNLPLKKRTDGYQARAKAAKREVEKLSKQYQDLVKKIKKCEDDAANGDQEATDLRLEVSKIRKAVNSKKSRLANMRKDIQHAETGLLKAKQKVDAIPPSLKAELEGNLERLKRERAELRQAEVRANDQVLVLQNQRQELEERRAEQQKSLKGMLSVSARRLEGLNTPENRDTYEAVKWLEEEGYKRFKEKVYEPAILSLGIKDKSLAIVAESCFRNSDLLTFTCLSREDYKLFNELVIDNKERRFDRRLNVRVVEYSQGKKFDDWTSPCSNNDLKRLGFDCWLKDILTGPKEVINTLCHSNQIHAVAISRKSFAPAEIQAVENFYVETQNRKKNIIEKYVAGNITYQVVRSKYGNQNPSTTTNTIRNKSSYLSDTVDLQKKAQLERELATINAEHDNISSQYQAVKAEEDEIGDTLNKIKTEHDAIRDQRDTINKTHQLLSEAEGKLETKKSALEREENAPDTSENDLARVQRKQEDLASTREELAIALTEYVKEAIQTLEMTTVAKMKSIQADADAARVVAESGVASQQLHEALSELGRLDDELKKAKERAGELIAAAQKQLADAGKDEDEAAELLRDALETGDSVEGLEAQLEEEQNTLRISQQQNTVGVMEAYEKRAREIQEIQDRMAERQTQVEDISGQITQFRQIWEPRLQTMVARVSAAFGDAFNSIGCAGEVLLSKSGDNADDLPTDDFEKWAIQIKVKFRETEKLQLLTGQRQSGGERSVSTIFYLMALQDLAKAPFRVVDEINQGMDPRNERLVHGRMVDAACRPDTSQYFLITPKLLPGLKYHRNMKILTVNNGKFVPQALDVGGIIQSAQALQGS